MNKDTQHPQNSRIAKQKPNGNNKLFKQEWKTEQDYKKQIIALQLQNEKYRNQLYELGQTVNKILDKVKQPQKNYNTYTPNLEQQMQLVKKQLHNVNQFIQIYQKQLSVIGSKKKKDQIQNLAATQELLKAKTEELNSVRKQVRQLSHKNKGLQYKLIQYSKKNRTKSIDQQALQLKQLINQNKSLKSKLQQLETLHQKKQVWLKNNIESAKQLQLKIQQQESKLPKIQSRHSQRASSLPKLQNQKKIYTKWLQSTKSKKNPTLQKQLQDLQKINKMVQEKIKHTTDQIRDIETQIQKMKQKVSANELQNVDQSNQKNRTSKSEEKLKKKHISTMVSNKPKKMRKDWVGKFDSLRFSDSRTVRQQSRIYKVNFNDLGYYQFSYYSVKDKEKKYTPKLPFDTTALSVYGKQSKFTVQYPDFIKNIRLKINIKTHRITQMHLVSNLGIQASFSVDQSLQNFKDVKGKDKQKQKPILKEDQTEVNYQMDVKSTEAITSVFGSYVVKYDQKKYITNLWLEGFGVEVIEDSVEELI